jgi:hypothetical protein
MHLCRGQNETSAILTHNGALASTVVVARPKLGSTRRRSVATSHEGQRLSELEVVCNNYHHELMRLRELVQLQAALHKQAEMALSDQHVRFQAQIERCVISYKISMESTGKKNAVLDEELGRWMDDNEKLRETLVQLEERTKVADVSGAGVHADVPDVVIRAKQSVRQALIQKRQADAVSSSISCAEMRLSRRFMDQAD